MFVLSLASRQAAIEKAKAQLTELADSLEMDATRLTQEEPYVHGNRLIDHRKQLEEIVAKLKDINGQL
jgi:hypothetical protein